MYKPTQRESNPCPSQKARVAISPSQLPVFHLPPDAVNMLPVLPVLKLLSYKLDHAVIIPVLPDHLHADHPIWPPPGLSVMQHRERYRRQPCQTRRDGEHVRCVSVHRVLVCDGGE